MTETIETLTAWFSRQGALTKELAEIVTNMLGVEKSQLIMDDDTRHIKQELLENYALKEPVEFIQFDAFDASDSCDSIIVPDEDGDCLTLGERFELLSGDWDVRVFVTRERIEKEKTIRMLKKIINWIETRDSLKQYLVPREDTQNNEVK